MAKEKPATKICKYCATEIPYDAKVCPNCRKKVKGGIIKWILMGFVLILILGSLIGGGEDTGSQDMQPSDTKQAEARQKTPKKKSSKAPKKIEYTEYDITELLDDIKDNALKAEKMHQDEYVKIHGYLSTIDSDGSYICIGAAEDDYDYIFQNIQCYVQSEDQLNQIMEMSKGDAITVEGQISSIGEVMGYSLKIDAIR